MTNEKLKAYIEKDLRKLEREIKNTPTGSKHTELRVYLSTRRATLNEILKLV